MMRIFVWYCSSIVLVLISVVTGQLDSHGFLSIDCGLPPNSTFVESETGFTFVSDEQFIDTGNISQISSSYVLEDPAGKEFQTVRYFPTGVRNCYTVNSLIIGFKYLVRGLFIYGNYDKLNEAPIFDIYLGANFWFTVNTSSPSYPEITFRAAASYVYVCLVNKGLGIPFISSLHLRQVKKDYLWVDANTSLVNLYRFNLGASSRLVRYPDDSYDRFWWSYTKIAWEDISTTSPIALDSNFEVPSCVMQTAATTSSINEPLFINMTAGTKLQTHYVLHFAEIQNILSTDIREFNISVRGYIMGEPYIPGRQSSMKVYIDGSVIDYSVSLDATSNSTLPPLLNAVQLYKLIIPLQVPTDGGDVSAINTIKGEHQIKKGWSGDPCIPLEFRWSGIDCILNPSNISRITGLNLSSSKLTGSLSDYFGKLIVLESLDLSNNDLSGSLPASLGQLTALAYLDIRGNNKISTTLPPALQRKQQDGSLIFRFDDQIPTPPPSSRSSPSSSKRIMIIVIAVAVALLGIPVALVTVFIINKRKSPLPADPSQPGAPSQQSIIGAEQILPNLEKFVFSDNDIRRITNDFKTKIGTGGYGSVYLGTMEIRKEMFQVAVKMPSASSRQGVQHFLAEAENLTRVHHKNLVSLMGYSTDKKCMALVYEYMPNGNLYDKLRDYVTPLAWKERLRIASESALGLEYLHIGCNPPIIHRDVKTSNILLSESLEARISDFGLSRAFSYNDAQSHLACTKIDGTIGYLDPEYCVTAQVSTKSDVYSFGVVLLEIITGRPPVIRDLEETTLVQWVNSQLSGGNIRSIVDPRMPGEYDVNSVWTVTELACKCTNRASFKRPTMSEVVSQLKESMPLENSTDEEILHISYMPVGGPSVR